MKKGIRSRFDIAGPLDVWIVLTAPVCTVSVSPVPLWV